jgi:hypothetical protein
MIFKLPTETTQSPNYPKVLSGWVGEKQSKEIISKDSKELPYWFDFGICQRIVNEVAILDHQDKDGREVDASN